MPTDTPMSNPRGDADVDDWTEFVTPEMLRCRVTLGEYFAESRELVAAGKVSQSAIDCDQSRLEALAQPGDTWWEWVLGTEPLRQMGGLALVRSQRIVWARLDWIS